MRTLLLLTILAACAPHGGTAYITNYDVRPRALLPAALDATREMHYQVAALDSKDAAHASFLALDGVREQANTALLVQIAPTKHLGDLCKRAHCRRAVNLSTVVAVTPLAFRDGRELPDAEVPASTRADAERLMLAIYDRARSDRRF
jgi:hypothetical protein